MQVVTVQLRIQGAVRTNSGSTIILSRDLRGKDLNSSLRFLSKRFDAVRFTLPLVKSVRGNNHCDFQGLDILILFNTWS